MMFPNEENLFINSPNKHIDDLTLLQGFGMGESDKIYINRAMTEAAEEWLHPIRSKIRSYVYLWNIFLKTYASKEVIKEQKARTQEEED